MQDSEGGRLAVSMNEGSKRGYLQEDFMFFHLKDRKNNEFEYHYHEFNKITIFISGNVTYHVEGRAYSLKPWDILLVNSHEVHKPLIDPNKLYERMVFWINPLYLEKHSTSDNSLLACFNHGSSEGRNLLRLDTEKLRNIRNLLHQLDEEYKANYYASKILRNAMFIQLMVQLNRAFLGQKSSRTLSDIVYDDNISAIIRFIGENLDGDLSVEGLASRFYMSRSYLMHRFKECTGYSLHSYITQKRLIKASSLIKNGMQSSGASITCGFGDYSSFVRAFVKMFGMSPRNYARNTREQLQLFDTGKHIVE